MLELYAAAIIWFGASADTRNLGASALLALRASQVRFPNGKSPSEVVTGLPEPTTEETFHAWNGGSTRHGRCAEGFRFSVLLVDRS